MEKKRTTEIIIGMVFLTFLLFFILVVIQFSSQKKVYKTNSFVDYNINIQYNYENKFYVSPEIIQKSKIFRDNDIVLKRSLKPIYNTNQYKYKKKGTIEASSKVKKTSKYSYSGSHKKTSTLGLYTDTFVVNVNNLAGGQGYTVVWIFEDYWGNQRIYEDTKYIFGHDSQRFFFKDISKDSTYYYSWNYQVIPRLK